MRMIPAVDMMDHRVVQLVGGVPGSEKIVLPDPVSVAMAWIDKGAEYLHLVDLDAAFGKESNIPVFKKIIGECGVPVEIGGGIRDTDTVDGLISAGADRVIVGTRAIREPDWLAEIADRHPKRIVLSMDTKGGAIAIKGWQESSSVSVEEMFDLVRSLPLSAVLNTDVDVEGRKQGIDADKARSFIRSCPFPVIASGGVTTETDALILSEAGAESAVIGLALYTGTIRPWEWNTPWKA